MTARAPLASVRFRAGGVSFPAAAGAAGSTAQTLKFSSPSLSLTKRTYFESRLQKKPATGRFGSAVTRRALSYGSPVFLTQTFRVSFHGLRNAVHFPSGESCAPAISGLPKKSSRSRSGGRPLATVAFETRAGRAGAATARPDAATGSARADARRSRARR